MVLQTTLRTARASKLDFELIQTGENLGFAGGNVCGLRSAAADPEVGWFLLINNDVAVDPIS